MATEVFLRKKDRSTQDDHKPGVRLRFHAQRRGEPRFTAAPCPRRIASVRTRRENRACVGDFIRIRGKNLNFDPNDPRAGVFFIDCGETRSTFYVRVTSELVIARVPDGLSAGPYLLRLRSSNGNAEYREGRAPSVFIVE